VGPPHTNAGLSRSGVSGARRRRTPVASKMALAMAAGNRADRALAGAGGRQFGTVDLKRLTWPEDGFSYEVPMVRIRLPPAESQQTFGS
jgi:hypothetical protein